MHVDRGTSQEPTREKQEVLRRRGEGKRSLGKNRKLPGGRRRGRGKKQTEIGLESAMTDLIFVC